MESKMNEFIKITEGEKVALIDPVGKVCLGVSKRFADNLDKPEFQEKLCRICYLVDNSSVLPLQEP